MKAYLCVLLKYGKGPEYDKLYIGDSSKAKLRYEEIVSKYAKENPNDKIKVRRYRPNTTDFYNTNKNGETIRTISIRLEVIDIE